MTIKMGKCLNKLEEESLAQLFEGFVRSVRFLGINS